MTPRLLRAALLVLLLVPLACATREPEPSAAARAKIAEAQAAERDGDWTAALAALDAARSEDPRSPHASLEAGRLLAAMGFYAEAVAAWEDAARRAPRSPRPWLQLAALYRASERSMLVVRSVEAARKANERDPDVLVEVGRERLAANDLWAASRALGDALTERPNDAGALALMGTIERRRQALGEAEQALKRAIEQAPGHVEARLELAGLYRDLDRPRDAIAQLEPLLATSREPAVCYELARLYQKVGRGAEGLKMSERHLQLQVARDQPRGVREHLWTEPGNADIRSRLGNSWLTAGEPAQAEGIFRGWLRGDASNADAWNGVAMARLAQNDTAGATRSLERSLAANPDHVPTLVRLAALAAAAGHPDKASELLGRAQAIDAAHPMLQLVAGGAQP